MSDEQELIDRYVDTHTERYPAGPADARLREYGVSVWALVGHLHAVGGDVDKVAEDYLLPREAVEAALAYYGRYKKLIDARLLLNAV